MSTDHFALTAMIALRNEIEARLMQNQDYRALSALNKAIAEVSPPVSAAAPRVVEAVGTAVGGSHALAVGAAIGRAPSQPDAVAHILEQYGPKPTSDLVTMVVEMGVPLGGVDPLINLSSSISKSGRFKSIRINGVPHWWFKDREMPATGAAEANPNGGETSATASDVNTSDGGNDAAA